MNYGYIADLLFPDVTLTPEEIEARYPKRELPEGGKVTRFAPSPTGFVHFGGLFPSTVCGRLAHQSGGVFYLRIEDTDDKREVPGAAQALITAAKVRALIKGRYNVSYEDINTLAIPVLRHRIKLGFEAVTSKMSPDDVVISLVRDLNTAKKGLTSSTLGVKKPGVGVPPAKRK